MDLKELTKRYGTLPARPEHLSVVTNSIDMGFAAGKAALHDLTLILYYGEREISFPTRAVIPNTEKPHPAFIYISDSGDIPSKFLPAEEIADRGFAIFCISREDIAPNGTKRGLARTLLPGKKYVGGHALLAFAAMRIADYTEKLTTIDSSRLCAIAHGELAEAALLSAAYDRRFSYAMSNCPDTESESSLYCKASFSLSGNERIEKLCELLDICGKRAIISAPRDDICSDELLKYSGLRLRDGTRYLSREDWQFYMDVI